MSTGLVICHTDLTLVISIYKHKINQTYSKRFHVLFLLAHYQASANFSLKGCMNPASWLTLAACVSFT